MVKHESVLRTEERGAAVERGKDVLRRTVGRLFQELERSEIDKRTLIGAIAQRIGKTPQTVLKHLRALGLRKPR